LDRAPDLRPKQAISTSLLFHQVRATPAKRRKIYFQFFPNCLGYPVCFIYIWVKVYLIRKRIRQVAPSPPGQIKYTGRSFVAPDEINETFFKVNSSKEATKGKGHGRKARKQKVS
jgi:hypothetical protein